MAGPADASVRCSERGVLGVVGLWANTSAVTQFLPADLAAFATLQPGIRIELNEADSQEVVLAVLEGRADLGIFAERTPALGLQTLHYRTDRLALESSHLGKALRTRIRVRSFDAMCQMVAAGLGIAVLPDAALQPLVKALGLRKLELSDAWVERDLLLGARDLGALQRPVRSLIDHFEEQCKAARQG